MALAPRADGHWTDGRRVPRRCSWQLLQPGGGEQVPGGSGRRVCLYEVHQGRPGHLGGQQFPHLLQVGRLGLAAAVLTTTTLLPGGSGFSSASRSHVNATLTSVCQLTENVSHGWSWSR